MNVLSSRTLLGKRARTVDSEAIHKLEMSALQRKQMKMPDSETDSDRLSLAELRGPEYQHLFNVLKKMTVKLSSWSQIIEPLLNRTVLMLPEALVARGMFCDGFDFPKAGHHGVKELEQHLDQYDLHVRHINLHSSEHHAFVKLDDEAHIVTDIIASLRSIFEDHATDTGCSSYLELISENRLTPT